MRVPEGGEYRVVLSDGTKVWINSGSELTFPMNFEKGERVVELKGEAYFDVTKSKEWPFIVRTCRSSVKVLGTSFNVCSYEEDALEQVTLEQGGVEVKHHDETYLLHPGEQFELDTTNEEVEVKPVNVKLYTSWIDGMFRFHNMLYSFHHYNRIIDHGSDGKHKREKGEQVDGESNHGHHGECADDGNEDGYGRDKR